MEIGRRALRVRSGRMSNEMDAWHVLYKYDEFTYLMIEKLQHHKTMPRTEQCNHLKVGPSVLYGSRHPQHQGF